MGELKPCAHCGGKAELFIGNFIAMVECLECKVRTHALLYEEFGKEKAIEKAVEIWNRRVNNG